MSTAQKLFYVHRETTWAQLDITGVEEIGDALVLRGTVSLILSPSFSLLFGPSVFHAETFVIFRLKRMQTGPVRRNYTKTSLPISSPTTSKEKQS
jgi:hypothetical protein